MKKLSILTLIALTVVFLDSCTTIKKRYSSGYTVVWNQKTKSKKLNSTVDLSSNKNKVNKNESAVADLKLIENPTLNNNFNDIQSENSYQVYNNSSSSELASSDEQNVNPLISTSNKNIFHNSYTQSPSDKINSSDKQNEVKAPVKSFKNKLKKVTSSGDTELILGIILCLFGLAPFGVRYVKGKRDSAYKTNLMIWLGGWGCLLIGIITAFLMASAGSISILGLALYGIGGLLLFISFIHGLISILK